MGLSQGRKIALKVVRRVRDRQSYAAETMQSVLQQVGAKMKVSPRDKAFATRLSFGTIATRGTLDELVAAELSRPESTPDEVKDALAIAAYELFFEGTEPYVVVDQGVEMVRFATQSKTYNGLANAVLRRLSQRATDIFPGGNPLTDVVAQARLYGHPVWMAELLRSEYGVQTAGDIMAVNNEPAPLYVAHLPFLQSEKQSLAILDAAGISWEDAGLAGAVLIHDRSAFWALPADQRKSFTAMDLAAQQVVALCQARPDQSILEVGSGRGTKSLALAAAARKLGGPARITGVDLHDFKTKLAQRTADEYGVREVRYITADVTKHSAAGIMERQNVHPSFDTVLVDAPCSGLGTLRRASDKRWKLKSADIPQLARLSLQMLSWSAQLVADDGTLLFATCTINREENSEVIAAFLKTPTGQGFQVEPVQKS
ncbi:MAG: methyltransferase domain-containing protein [Coriobacteriia bacterium]|nr:methyltransferase domain-containing protein [Coriobacteriia bacterium]